MFEMDLKLRDLCSKSEVRTDGRHRQEGDTEAALPVSTDFACFSLSVYSGFTQLFVY